MLLPWKKSDGTMKPVISSIMSAKPLDVSISAAGKQLPRALVIAGLLVTVVWTIIITWIPIRFLASELWISIRDLLLLGS
jgi:hypothetical protein